MVDISLAGCSTNLVNALGAVLWNWLTVVDHNVKVFLVLTVGDDLLLRIKVVPTEQSSADGFLFAAIIETIKIGIDLEQVSILHMKCLDFKPCKILKQIDLLAFVLRHVAFVESRNVNSKKRKQDWLDLAHLI